MKRIYRYSVLLIAIMCCACGNSQTYRANTTSDMKFVEVQGPVKAIIQSGVSTNFDRSGRITSITYNDTEKTPYTIQRNSNGQIIKVTEKLSENSEVEKFEYICVYDESGYIVETTETDPWTCSTFKFTNSGGLHKKAHVEYVHETHASFVDEKDERTGIVTYSYPETDAYGNWTKRKNKVNWIKGKSDGNDEFYTTREIIYWK